MDGVDHRRARFLITGLRSFAEWKDQPIVTSKTAQAKTFGQFIVIYYILTLYVAENVPIVYNEFKSRIDSLMHPQVLFGMMLLVMISTIGTGLLYLLTTENSFMNCMPNRRNS